LGGSNTIEDLWHRPSQSCGSSLEANLTINPPLNIQNIVEARIMNVATFIGVDWFRKVEISLLR